MKKSTERTRRFKEREKRVADAQKERDEGQAFKNYLRLRGLSPSTIETYVGRVRFMEGRLQAVGSDLSTATTELLRDCWPAVKQDCHNGTVGGLRHWYTWKGIADPTVGIPRLARPRRLPRPYSDPERDRYISAARELGPRYLSFALLGLMAGLRVHEMAGLQWADVGEHLNVIGKGGKQRRIPVSPQLAEALDLYRPTAGPKYVFTSSQAPYGPVGPQRLRRMGYQTLRRAGMFEEGGKRGSNGPHILRHTAATTLYKATKDVLLLQRYLGHSSFQTSAVYIAVSGDPLKGAQPFTRAATR